MKGVPWRSLDDQPGAGQRRPRRRRRTPDRRRRATCRACHCCGGTPSPSSATGPTRAGSDRRAGASPWLNRWLSDGTATASLWAHTIRCSQFVPLRRAPTRNTSRSRNGLSPTPMDEACHTTRRSLTYPACTLALDETHRARLRAGLRRGAADQRADRRDRGAASGRSRGLRLPPRSVPRNHYIGCDIQEGANVDQVEDIHALSFADGSVGTVVCVEVLEHVFDPIRAVQEIHRVLRPGGVAILTSVMFMPIHAHPWDFWRFTPEGFAQAARAVRDEPRLRLRVRPAARGSAGHRHQGPVRRPRYRALAPHQGRDRGMGSGRRYRVDLGPIRMSVPLLWRRSDAGDRLAGSGCGEARTPRRG